MNILLSSEFIIFNGLYPSIGLLPLSGPGGQTGRGAPGQYVYWICMAHPTQETLVAKPGMKTPADFSRESFTELVVNVHSSCTVELEEVACFLEPRAKGQPHLDALVRSLRQYRWKSVAEPHASAPHSEQLPVKCCKYCIIYNTSYTLL